MSQELPEFDTLMQLAKTDSKAFDALREKLVAELIGDAPQQHQRRLRGMQFVVDQERGIAKNPMASLLKISSMMLTSLDELRVALNEPAELKAVGSPSPSSATVLALTPRSKAAK